MTTAITKMITWLRGAPVGEDSFGNRYYQEKTVSPGRRRKRWIVYNGEAEASRVPPLWHQWLHYTVDEVPQKDGTPPRPWQKEHLPNLTGTPAAYRPPGHTLRGGLRDRATGDYEAWSPE